jgi:hypothetical protein
MPNSLAILRHLSRFFTRPLVQASLFPLFLIVLYICLVFFRVHGSSVGVYTILLNGESVQDQQLIFGTPRMVRSDEWLGGVTATTAQFHNDLRHRNPAIGQGQEMSVLYDAPTDHWSAVFRPFTWAFFMNISLERAFTFKWWYHPFVMMVGLYLFLYYLSRRPLISALFTVGTFFMPFNQWWQNMTIYGGIGYISLCLIGMMWLFKEKRWWVIMLITGGITYLSACFILLLYPPFQISLLYIGALFFGAFLLQQRQQLTKKILLKYTGVLFTVGFLSGIFLILYIYDFRDVFQLITGTVYPGARFFTGGDYHPALFFSSYFNSQLQFISETPALFKNQNEASSYLMFYPFYLPVLIYFMYCVYRKTQKVPFALLLFSLFLIAGTIFLFIGFHPLLAKLSLFYLIPPKRLIFGIGLANILVLFLYLFWDDVKKVVERQSIAVITGIVTFFAVYASGNYLLTFFEDFVQQPFIVPLMAAGMSVTIYAFLMQKKLLVAMLFCAMSVYSGFMVNPLYQGLDPLYSRLSTVVSDIQKRAEPSDRWIVYNSGIWGNYLVGLGVPTFNSIHLYPHFYFWRTLDPTERYSDVYNRYANVLVANSYLNDVQFVDPEDRFSVLVHPCQPELQELGIRFYLSYRIEMTEICLKPLKTVEYPTGNFYIYEYQEIELP